jgi:hypothetical protein
MRRSNTQVNEGINVFTAFLNPLTNKMVTVVPTLLPDAIAGYNKEGTRIYIDVLTPAWMWTPVISHETLEMALILELGFKYEWAHQQATALERRVVEGLGLNWETYDKTFHQILDLILKREPRPPQPADMHIHSD